MQSTLTWLLEGGRRCVSRPFVTFIVLTCLLMQGSGPGIVVSTFARLATEEAAEESNCEFETREGSHKCCRMDLMRPCGMRVSMVSPREADRLRSAPRLPVPLLATHLIGAGINMRC